MQQNYTVKFEERSLTHTKNGVALDGVAIDGRCGAF